MVFLEAMYIHSVHTRQTLGIVTKADTRSSIDVN